MVCVSRRVVEIVISFTSSLNHLSRCISCTQCYSRTATHPFVSKKKKRLTLMGRDMIWLTIYSKIKFLVPPLLANFLISWTILPLAVPPFGFYSLNNLMEVLLWQGIATIGWPFAILGGIANLFQLGYMSSLVSLLIVLIYPTMLLLLIFFLFSKRNKRWMLILLHILLTFSFVAIWYQVLNGFDFMIG